MGQDSDPKQENTKQNSRVEESDKMQSVFGQHTDLFRESWGLPPAPEKDSENSSTDDEEGDEKDLAFTTEIKVTKGKKVKDNQDEIREDNDNKDDMKDEETDNKDDSLVDSTEANFDDSFEYQNMVQTEDNPETVTLHQTKEFNLKLGAGPRSIKLSKKSSGSSPPVFSKSSEGLLEDEEEEDFGKAWARALFVCLERRVAAGHRVEEVMTGLMEELGLDKFREIVEHFLGSLRLEQIEDKTDMTEQK